MSGPSDAGAYMAPNPRTLAQRLMRLLFPYAMPPVIDEHQAFSTHTTVTLSWKDRLRVLVSGCIRLDYRHVTDVEVKSVTSSCTFYIESPLERPKRSPQIEPTTPWPRT